MANAVAANRASPTNRHEFIAPDDLHFDPDNPRFDQQFKDEKAIISYLYDYVDVDELIQSILSAGYVDFEPLVVLRATKTVIEGNRRLAAVRLISKPDLCKELKI